ncbi:hypothetical protein EVG20_g3530 [Dentipellis fragilis]|uniref:Uncharacterized protein n=1 Tax=Dentipellis fragilis TaxID=205917 RepID=A0A4Y9Z1K1_9AGAM|nr:hypothetical protein EVG20_g3530 [Dentipellis fragilis]
MIALRSYNYRHSSSHIEGILLRAKDTCLTTMHNSQQLLSLSLPFPRQEHHIYWSGRVKDPYSPTLEATMTRPPTRENIVTVARRAVGALRRRGLSCYLVGSMASMLWETDRAPNDIDIVILITTYDAEAIKRLLVASDKRFFLVPSRNPRNTYKVLWYEIPTASRFSNVFEEIKVDILVPPTLNMPFLDGDNIVWKEELPVCPLLPLLLLRLQGWEDHIQATRRDLVEKQYTDVMDIKELLAIAVEAGVTIEDEPWLDRPFLSAARRRIQSYVRIRRGSRASWRKLGFVLR